MTLYTPAHSTAPAVRDHAAAAVRAKTILITGHRGFLGSTVAERLRGDDYTTVGVGVVNSKYAPVSSCNQDYELEFPDTRFDEIIKDAQPDALIHCAGTADVAASFRDPPTDYRKNVESVAFVVESLRRYAPRCHFVLLSSAAVYGNPRSLPVREDARCIPISPYGCHKLFGEQIVEDFVTERGLQATILRIFSAYGVGLRKQVVYDLCRKLYDETQDRVELYGSGDESRDFINALDIAAAVEHVVARNITGLYNLACGVETTIAELADKMLRLSGRQVKVEFTGKSRAGDPLRWQADIHKLLATGYTSTVTLDEGLHSYIDWFRKTELN